MGYAVSLNSVYSILNVVSVTVTDVPFPIKQDYANVL